MKRFERHDLAFAETMDKDDELKVDIKGSIDYLTRKETIALRNLLDNALKTDPSEEGVWV